MSILVIAEHDNATLSASTLKTLSGALQLGDDIHVLVAGFSADAVATQAAKVQGVNKVWHYEHASLAHPLAENLSQIVLQHAQQASHILVPATTFGKNVLPRVAAMLDVGQVSDVIEISANDTFKRPIYAGNAIATVKAKDAIKVISLRPVAFPEAITGDSAASIEKLTDFTPVTGIEFVQQQLNESERPELTAAKIIVSGGRGLQSGENFKLLEALADKLNAAIGASRAAVDAGFVPNDYQVGQTGKVVAPELYIAIGISGAIQHLAGMSDSKIIVAINKDEDAPIFQIATYGLVGDLFEIVPKLTELLA